MGTIIFKQDISRLFFFLILILGVLPTGCSPHKKSNEYSMDMSTKAKRPKRDYIKDMGRDSDVVEHQNPEMKVNQGHILAITKESTFPIMSARRIDDVCVSLLAVPSQNFQSVLEQLKQEESLKFYSGSVAVDKGARRPEYQVLEPMLNNEKYKSEGLVLLDLSIYEGLPSDDFTSFINIDFHNKKVIRGSLYDYFSPTEQELWMMKKQYMTSEEKWSKSWWTKESTTYVPLSLKPMLESAQLGDTFKTFFIVSVSKIKDDLYTSDFIYISGLDDPSNSNLVQEFTVID